MEDWASSAWIDPLSKAKRIEQRKSAVHISARRQEAARRVNEGK